MHKSLVSHSRTNQRNGECGHAVRRQIIVSWPVTFSQGEKRLLLTGIHCSAQRARCEAAATSKQIRHLGRARSILQSVEVAGPPPSRPSSAAGETLNLALRREPYVS